VGEKAPDFTLLDTDRKERSLREFLGTKTVLAFYPGVFTSTCTKEMCAFRDSLADLSRLNARVVGISVDPPFAGKAFAESNRINFPLLSDHTRGTIDTYGIVHEGFSGLKGYTAAYRSVFVLDADGIVKYAWVSENPGIEPPYDEIQRAVASM